MLITGNNEFTLNMGSRIKGALTILALPFISVQDLTSLLFDISKEADNQLDIYWKYNTSSLERFVFGTLSEDVTTSGYSRACVDLPTGSYRLYMAASSGLQKSVYNQIRLKQLSIKSERCMSNARGW